MRRELLILLVSLQQLQISCCNNYYVYISQVVSWLRDVQVKDVTNTSAIIQYTTADCVVKEIENLTIELIITGDSSDIDPSSPVLYENATMGIFNLTNLEPDNVVNYAVQVVVEVITIGTIHTGSFTVSPAPPPSTTTTSTTMSTSMSSSFTSGIRLLNLNVYSTCFKCCTYTGISKCIGAYTQGIDIGIDK